MLTTNFHDGRYDQATSVAVDSHNRIVAAGNTADQRCFGDRCAGSRFALARYGHHGALDHSFSRNGKVANPHGNALSAAIDSRDRIVAAGVNAHRFAVARYIGRGPDGKVVRAERFRTTGEALEAAGLSE